MVQYEDEYVVGNRLTFLRHVSPYVCAYKRRYRKASRDVLEESRLAASDDFKVAAISFFDEKRASLHQLKAAYFFL